MSFNSRTPRASNCGLRDGLAQAFKSMPPKHDWEEGAAPPPGGRRRHAWESDSGSERGAASDAEGESSDSDLEVERYNPEDELISTCLELFYMRRLNARELSTILYWAGECGKHKCSMEESRRLGHKPGAPSGHYSRNIKSKLNLDEATGPGYCFDIVSSQRHLSLGRCKHRLFTPPPHETRSRKVDSSLRVKLSEAKSQNKLPPCYHSHPVVVANPQEPVFPYAIYMDGLPYSQEDGVLGIWLVNLLTGERILFVVLRKRLLCTCGCRGWCSLFPVFLFIWWSLRAAAQNVWPGERHDFEDWDILDGDRKARVGTPLGRRWSCLWISGDWAEYAHTLGFPAWNDGLRPCYECNCDTGNLLSLAGECSSHALPWRENAEGEYFAACTRCEIWVEIDAAAHRAIKSLLVFDKRQEGSHGRALLPPGLPDLGLRAGDRLEPHRGLMDIGEGFDDLDCSAGAVRVLFWRPEREFMTRHRNPMFDIELGLTPSRSLTVDTLHCLYLGVLLDVCKVIVWWLIEHGKWGVVGTLYEQVQVAAMRIRYEFEAWMRDRRQANPGEGLTRAFVGWKKLGTHSEPKLKLKGAETYSFFFFFYTY